MPLRLRWSVTDETGTRCRGSVLRDTASCGTHCKGLPETLLYRRRRFAHSQVTSLIALLRQSSVARKREREGRIVTVLVRKLLQMGHEAGRLVVIPPTECWKHDDEPTANNCSSQGVTVF